MRLDRIAFSTLLMGLLVGVQPVRVELSPDLAPATIVYYLDGTAAGGATAPPWEVRIDFGHDLRPHELVAAAMNAAGDRIASVSRIVNLPAPESRLDLLIERKGSRPPSSIRLVATSLTREKPLRQSLTLDGRPLALDAEARAALPPLDLALTHVLSATAEFTQESVARADLAIGGGIQDESGSRLTAVAIRVSSDDNPTVESLRGRLRSGAQALRVVAVEKGDASVFLVRNPDTKAMAHVLLGNIGGGVRLEDSDRVRLVWPISDDQQIADQRVRLLESTRYFTGRDGGLLWVLARISRATPSVGPYLYADAVAVAGLYAYQAGTRRAVVLAGVDGGDASDLAPAQARSYLESLGVPFHVWSSGATEEAWGKPKPLRWFVDFQRAAAILKRDLDSQRIVWVAGEWQPGQIELVPGSDGVSLLR